MNNAGSNSAAARAARARRTVVALVLAIGALSCSSGNSGGDDVADAGVAPPGETKYVPEGDEGLGASIAIVVDNSGSMNEIATGDDRPKYIVAREALEAMIVSTDSFAARRPDFPIKVGLMLFASKVQQLVPVSTYDRAALTSALASMPKPGGGTAIGMAMDAAREELYRAGTIRKYILVVTDGENTNGRSPRAVAREIFRRSEGAVRIYFVAFDIDAKKFNFLSEVRGEVLGAGNGLALRASLDTIYQGRILAEATDAGETLPAVRKDTASDSAATVKDSIRRSTSPKKRKP